MRLDKYLKVSRLIKRRTVANDACDSERISVNGKSAKASYNVKVGDIITVSFGTRSVSVRVLDIRETTKKTEAVGMYEVISDDYA
ncbi:MAG: RNA-binding S4 domain-containing protein [Clostridia bacterium]|nr:RNA-binding S4 domain-containing protein [Clostridia bacterium]